MKIARFVLKIVAVITAITAVVCCVVAYWDQIADCIGSLPHLKAKHSRCTPSEYDDYADWDE